MRVFIAFIFATFFTNASYAKTACLFKFPSKSGAQTCTFNTVEDKPCIDSTTTSPTFQDLYDIAKSSKPLASQVAKYLKVNPENDVFSEIYKRSFLSAQVSIGTECNSPKNLIPEASTTLNDCEIVEAIVRDFNAHLEKSGQPVLEDSDEGRN